MVTHTQNFCSAYNPSKVHTHTQQWTHTHREHTPGAVGSHLCCGAQGSSWGALLKSTSVVVLRVERALYIHSPHLQFLQARDSNSQPLGYESDSLTIRPWLYVCLMYCIIVYASRCVSHRPRLWRCTFLLYINISFYHYLSLNWPIVVYFQTSPF